MAQCLDGNVHRLAVTSSVATVIPSAIIMDKDAVNLPQVVIKRV